MSEDTAIVWFRRDSRLHDDPEYAHEPGRLDGPERAVHGADYPEPTVDPVTLS